MHRVGVLVGDAAGGLVRLKCSTVAMRCDAQRRVILQCIERGSLPCLRGQQLFAQGQKSGGRRRSGNGAIRRDHHAPGFKPCLALAVRSGAALRRLNVNRAVDSVEFGQRRQTALHKLRSPTTGPTVVINSPGGTSALRAFSAATASGMVKTCSSGVCHPGRFPTSTMWLCASMRPGITVLPLRSMRLTLPRGRRCCYPRRRSGRSGSVLARRPDCSGPSYGSFHSPKPDPRVLAAALAGG